MQQVDPVWAFRGRNSCADDRWIDGWMGMLWTEEAVTKMFPVNLSALKTCGRSVWTSVTVWTDTLGLEKWVWDVTDTERHYTEGEGRREKGRAMRGRTPPRPRPPSGTHSKVNKDSYTKTKLFSSSNFIFFPFLILRILFFPQKDTHKHIFAKIIKCEILFKQQFICPVSQELSPLKTEDLIPLCPHNKHHTFAFVLTRAQGER